MRINATAQKVEALVLLLDVLLNEQPENPAEWLLHTMVHKVFVRLRAKTERIKTGNQGWGITLSMEEAVSLHLYCINRALPTGEYTYECLQLQSVLDQVDKEITACLCGTAQPAKMLAQGNGYKLLNE